MSTPDTSSPQDIADYLGTAKPRPWYKRKWVWIVAALLVAAGIAYSVLAGGEKTPDYITAEVTQRSLDLTVSATGNLRPTNQVEVGSEVSGRIDRVLVDVNDRVSQGQVLAIINTDVIEDQIAQSRANLNASRAAVAQARATLDVDVAQLGRLQEVFRLSDGRVPARSELEVAEGNVARGRASVASAQANVASSEASLRTSQTNRDRATIRSPVAGVVLARQVEPGQTVAASFNTPTLFVLAEDLSVMQLRVDLDEADVGNVEPGQQATFTVDAYPGRRFPARVERVDLAANNIAQAAETTQPNQVVSYEARLTVANGEGLLRPGMTATATVATASTGVSLLVPNTALRFDPDKKEDEGGSIMSGGGENFGLEEEEDRATIGVGSRQRVHVLGADGKLQEIQVVTGQSDGRLTVVTSNQLRPGMKVVTGIRVVAP